MIKYDRKTQIGEELLVSDYLVIKEYQSRFDPKKKYSCNEGMECPYCKKILPEIPHGATEECTCGLSMTVFGNSLQCVMDKKNFVPDLLNSLKESK